jgi:hypothetical protein
MFGLAAFSGRFLPNENEELAKPINLLHMLGVILTSIPMIIVGGIVGS